MPSDLSPEAQEKIDRLQPLLEMLVHACNQSQVAISGFLFSGDPPIMLYVGNVTETGDELMALHEQLADMYLLKHRQENVILKKLPPPVE
jgi:hypothetical protein